MVRPVQRRRRQCRVSNRGTVIGRHLVNRTHRRTRPRDRSLQTSDFILLDICLAISQAVSR
jgi:hypothetical protein